ncbi:MAG: peptide-binding protein [Desulfuromonadaceae bacterium]|nr:peptide-binding protein [Desulfuromonadaceae bacterium]MDD2846846.1 peptide-binding protein [Desulfuromonadaceae bacterium]MDD4129176.1 peptide-binding protein [Desulfuromonadaceae bacterium]
MKPSSGVRCLLPALLLCVALLACNRQQSPNVPAGNSHSSGVPVTGDSLIEGTIGEASTLIPLLATDASSHAVAAQIYNGLVKYDKNLTIVGDLAESFEVSKGGLIITFHLHRGVKWHDGTPLTSRDVLYTYQVTVDPKTPTAYAEDFKQVKSITTPDPYTIRVSYKSPFAPALASWGMNILPAHLLEGRDITKSPLSRNPVGTGPYRFKEWVPGQKIVLEANNDYFEGRPYIDRFIYRIIPDTSTMYMELKAGAIDLMNLTPVQFVRQTATQSFTNRFNKYRYPSSSYLYMGYNLRHPLFGDKRIRQAITAAINKDELVQGVLFGMGQKAHGPIVPGRWAYNPGVKDIAYDPVHAATLLAEAGWKEKNSDGILVKDGKPLKFTILTNQGNQQRLMTAQIIQQRLLQVGIDVKIRIVEWAAFLKEFVNKGNFEVVLLAWSISQDPDMYDVWHSSKNKPGELNFIGFNNPEVDQLLIEGRSTFDIEKRKRAYFRIQEILAEEQPYTFLYIPDSLPVVSARIRGVEPAPAGIGYNQIRWYVPKDEQVYVP